MKVPFRVSRSTHRPSNGHSALRRECAALLTLSLFLQSQYVLPLSTAWGQASPSRKTSSKTTAAKSSKTKGKNQIPSETSAAPKELEFSVTLAPVNLSKVPSQAELMAAGGLTGPLAPLGNADVKIYKEILAQSFNLASTSAFDQAANEAETLQKATGLGGELPILKAKQKLKRLENINLSFGKAINLRNQRKFADTAQSMREHLEKYPDSPWAGEVMLHLSLDALSNGRPAEAQARLQTLMENTVEDPEDPTWEIRCKTKASWANLDLTYGQWNTAIPELQEIIRSDGNSHRRMWAISWLAQARQLANIRSANLLACGSEALGAMLASVNPDASKRIQGLTPPDPSGFTLEEMSRIAKRHGVQVRGFKVVAAKQQDRSKPARVVSRVEQLARLPLPLIVHFDMARYGGQQKTTFGLRPRGAAWTSQAEDSIAPKATHAERKLAATRPHCEMCLPTEGSSKAVAKVIAKVKPTTAYKVLPQKTSTNKTAFLSRAVGHYLVVRKIDWVKRQVRLEDPTAHTGHTLSFEQLEKEWSGAGLSFSPRKFVPDAEIRQASVAGGKSGIIWLAKNEMASVRGGCCCAFDPPGGSGPPDGPPGTNPPSPGDDICKNGKGSPVMQVNPVTTNLYIHDTPIWYSPAVGPAIDLTLSYNSQDTGMYSTFGANWRLNFGSSLVENPGGQVFITEANGSTTSYVPNLAGTGYVSETGNFNVLTKTGTDHFEVTTPTGEKSIYDRPRNIIDNVLNVPVIVLNEVKDRFGYGVKVRYESYNKTIGSGGYTATLVRITRVIDAQSKITSFTYNANGYCTRITDPFGRQARFEYNASGQMSKVEDMGGDSFTYTYDANNLISSLTTAQGVWNVLFQFPSAGYNGTIDPLEYFDYIIKVAPPGQPGEYYRLDSPGFIYTDPNGRQTLYKTGDTIDNRPVYTKVIQPDGSETSYSYNHINGQVASITDGLGNSTSFSYNGRGQVTKVTNPNGHSNTMVYYPNGVDLKEVYNTRGNKIASTTYNSFHQVLTSTVYPTTGTSPAYTTNYTYTAWGAPATVTNPKNETTTYAYDGTTSLLVQVQRSATGFAARTIAAYTYDFIGRVRSETDAFGATRTISYNDLDKPIKTVYGDGSQETTDYVCCRLPGVTIDRSNRKTYYDYDAAKRLRRVQDSNGNTVQLDYDGTGNLISLLDRNGALTRWDYDVNNRVIRKTYADGSREGYAYDAAGRLLRSYDARGLVTKYEYDPVGHLTKIDYPSSPDEAFVYDDLERLQTMSDEVGTTGWTYDLLGRALSEDGPWANDTVTCGYNELSQRTGTNINSAYASTYTYDPLGRLTNLTSPASTGTTNPDWQWVYDTTKVGNSSLPSRLVRPNSTLTNYNWQAPLERLKDIKNYKSDGTTVLSQFVFGFDDVNKRDARMSQGRQMRGVDNVLGAYSTVNYGYDTTDQLLSETSSETIPEVKNSYVLDAMGNRNSWKGEGAGIGGTTATNVRSTGSNNRLNQMTSVTTLATDNSSSTLSQTFEARGNLSRTENTASDRYALYFFDDANRLEKILWQKRYNQPVPYQNIAQSIFYYDGMSRRRRVLEQTWNTGTATWATTSDMAFVYVGMDVAQERDSSTNVVRANLTRVGNIGGLLARQTYTGAGILDKTAFFHYDGNGNVAQTTDASQNVQSAYWYDAYGNNQKVSENVGYAQPYRYSTKWLHGTSGLYDYGFRFYNPSLGKWINRDPIHEQGGINLYASFQSNPINVGDSRGLSGIQFGNPESPLKFVWGDGQPGIIFDAGDLDEGHRYVVDTLDPFGNPWLDCGAYNPNDRWLQYSRYLTYTGVALGTAAYGMGLAGQAMGYGGMLQPTGWTGTAAGFLGGVGNASTGIGRGGYSFNDGKADMASALVGTAVGTVLGPLAGALGPLAAVAGGGLAGGIATRDMYPEDGCDCGTTK